MTKNKAIPAGYMLTGQLAKEMGVSNRTLQYYDEQGLLCPSAESEGGRRLYTHKDLVKLYQILSLKSLGFSLDDIKNRLMPLDTPADVAAVLSENAAAVRKTMKNLSETLQALESLQEEVLQMQSVDFKKYADIIVNLQMKNEFYWLIKHFDDKTLDYMRSRFTKADASDVIDSMSKFLDEVTKLQEEGIAPESKKGKELAKAFWEMIMQFTDGDLNMVSKMMETASLETSNKDWARVSSYIEPALGAYFTELGYDPFEKEQKK